MWCWDPEFQEVDSNQIAKWSQQKTCPPKKDFRLIFMDGKIHGIEASKKSSFFKTRTTCHLPTFHSLGGSTPRGSYITGWVWIKPVSREFVTPMSCKNSVRQTHWSYTVHPQPVLSILVFPLMRPECGAAFILSNSILTFTGHSESMWTFQRLTDGGETSSFFFEARTWLRMAMGKCAVAAKGTTKKLAGSTL